MPLKPSKTGNIHYKSKRSKKYRSKRYKHYNKKPFKFSNVVPLNSSVQILNVNRSNQVYRCSRSCIYQSFGIGPSNPAQGQLVFFDPAGTYSAGPTGVMVDWTTLTGLFDQYKVNKIKVTFSMADTVIEGNSCTLYCRYNYDLNFGTVNLTKMSDLPRVVRKSFTPDFPTFSYTIYPRVDTLVNNGAVLASEGHRVSRMGWCDVTNPVQLMGMCLYTTPTTANQEIWIDTEFDISFRMNT